MLTINGRTLRHKLFSWAALAAMAANVLTPIAAAQAQTSSPATSRTPIEHLIVVVGENHSFDNVFATYVPPDPTQSVWNLLSQGIIDKTGAPGANAAKALQRQATDQLLYQLAPPITGQFATLPQPSTTLNALPGSPCELAKLLFDGRTCFAAIPDCFPPTKPCFRWEEPANICITRRFLWELFIRCRIADIRPAWRLRPMRWWAPLS